MKCNSEILWTLVQQSGEPGAESATVARHIENCPACQSELERIGGGPADWADCKIWLADAGGASGPAADGDAAIPPLPNRATTDETGPCGLWPGEVDTSFLEPASHPEMLGRIGRYDVEGVLGRGGMGLVLKAYDTELRRPVAVKVMGPEWAASPVARERFAREAQAAASVAHENVIPIFNVDSSARLPFIVMRLINGQTLADWVTPETPMDTATILRVSGQLADGLAAAHRRGLVHRDIKPGNILVGENRARIWITDFGLARAADSVTLTRTGVIAGTPHYMSPEQARGEPLDHRSDLYSLGSVLFFMCVGRPPMQAENTLAVLHKIIHQRPASLAELRSDLPPTFVRLVASLLSMDPDDRPNDCETLTKTLETSHAELNRKVYAKPSAAGWSLARRIPVPVAIAAIFVFSLSAFVVSRNAIRWLTTEPAVSRPSFPSTSGPAVDGGADLGLDRQVVSPYIVAATDSILKMTAEDQAASARAIRRAGERVDRIEAAPVSVTRPSLGFAADAWKSDLRACEATLKALESS